MIVSRSNLKKVKEEIIKKYMSEKDIEKSKENINKKVDLISKNLVKKRLQEVQFDE